MRLVEILHRTGYVYRRPVELCRHTFMLKPTGGFDLEVLESELSLSRRAELSEEEDEFGNSVEHADFPHAADSLDVVASFTVLHDPRDIASIRYQFANDRCADEHPDVIARSLATVRPDPGGRVADWAWSLAEGNGNDLDVVLRMNAEVTRNFTYRRREERGAQDPAETLSKGTGSCRDFACLMVEACRILGYPARFVSGYIYDDMLDGLQGGASTHAWAQVHLGGAGWVEFDPTNGGVGGKNLVRSAVAMDPSDICPINASWYGAEGDLASCTVDVQTSSRPWTELREFRSDAATAPSEMVLHP